MPSAARMPSGSSPAPATTSGRLATRAANAPIVARRPEARVHVDVVHRHAEGHLTVLLVRDADGNLHSAAEIIPMAERSNLIVEIDRWVMGQALALIQERQAEGQQLRLFVPQSSLTLAAPENPKEAQELTRITESVQEPVRLDQVQGVRAQTNLVALTVPNR